MLKLVLVSTVVFSNLKVVYLGNQFKFVASVEDESKKLERKLSPMSG
jgi:hypothetical protein